MCGSFQTDDERNIMASKDVLYAHMLNEVNVVNKLDRDYKQMQKWQEQIDKDNQDFMDLCFGTPEDIEKYHQWHHVPHEIIPYWQVCVNKISNSLAE
jgi:hypothetical protein|tara:strand:- start:184 stop:474 length:291 start_codon:yes stop_codon:yes gene_type:complete